MPVALKQKAKEVTCSGSTRSGLEPKSSSSNPPHSTGDFVTFHKNMALYHPALALLKTMIREIQRPLQKIVENKEKLSEHLHSDALEVINHYKTIAVNKNDLPVLEWDKGAV